MMRQMRDNVKWIMALTAVTFVGLMVFGWGMDITGRSGAQTTGGELGRVNGDPISYQEWNNAYQNLYQQQQQASSAPLSRAITKQIEQAAWDQLVMQKLIGQELRARGIGVTDVEIREAAKYQPPPEFMDNPAFQTNGQFDINKYHQVMASPQIDEQLLRQLEAYYRDLIPRSKLFSQATAGAYLPDGELWKMYRDSRETAKVRYIFFDPATLIADSRVTVEPREIERYYRAHEDEFERPARAKVNFVAISRAPNAADTAAAKAKVDEIRARLVKGGDFAEIAKAESADSVSGREGGSLGKIRKGQTTPAFDAAAFSLPVGTLSDPVQTPFGYHLIQVQSRTGDEAEVRHILAPISLSEPRETALLERADSLDEVGVTYGLAEAAKRLGLQVRSADLEPGFAFLPGVGQAEEGAVWVFDDAEVGDVSDVLESPTSYYMVEVVERTEAGTRSLEEARQAITARLMQEKKLAEARLIARRALDAIRGGQTLDQAAQAVGLKVAEAGPFTRLDFVPGLGRANAAVGTAFGLNAGQTSGVVEAEGALFIIQTVERTPVDRKEWEAQKQAQQAQISQALAERRWTQFLQALRQNAKIVDNRDQVLKRDPTATTN